MSDYTPTTENVRDCVIFDFDMSEEETVARFDRWLAEVKAQAWEEGYKLGVYYDVRDIQNVVDGQSLNPYRQGEID